MPLSDLWSHIELDNEVPADDVTQMRRRLQTAPARVASANAKRRSREVAQSCLETPEQSHGEGGEFAQRLQKEYLTQSYQLQNHFIQSSNPDSSQFTDARQRVSRERARCIWSFMKQMLKTLTGLFENQNHDRDVAHLCCTVIADDTNTKLREQTFEKAVTFTVMNTVQSVFLRYGPGNQENHDDEHAWQGLFIPSPMQVLQSAKARSLHSSLVSWLVHTSEGMGCQWVRLGASSSLTSRAKWRTTILIGDALKANSAAWRIELQAMARSRQDESTQGQRLLGLRVKCVNHQVALVRRPVVLSVEGFWTSLVRLGHLFETVSFRRALSSALMSLVQAEGNFLRAWAEL